MASVLKTLWHHTDLMSGGASASGTSTAGGGKPVAPTLAVTNSALTVDAGGSVALPVSVTPSQGNHAVSVTISGLASYETVTDALDHQTFSGSSITLSAAQVNSGLSLASNYTGTDHPVNTLSLTAMDTVGHHAALSDAQTIVVTDPPVASGGTTAPATTTAATTTASAGNPLTLQVSGDMLGSTDPQIQVFVDGQQVGDASYDITAHHSQGQTQTIQIAGNFDPTVAHQVQVKLVNDNWDGTATTDGHDINVYVGSISL
ncbi:MAG TPA: carbohydrate-binding domain-containing protein, partial [Stellaceae bacterium]|nr:carbohydrate-binding domain-containing protein [Stellaceae bacterium]